ncbi:MAG: outer membrane beta-barrel protein [Gemmatimonadetes bacterium]|nr:outer membrane beta-barrel protein [Gemmatimonadota bacterium]
MKKIIAIIALLTFSATQAQADESWYVSAGVGTGFLLDAELDDPTGVLTALATEVLYDPGFGFSGALGYRWNKFRLEGEIAYDINDASQIAGALDTGKGRTHGFLWKNGEMSQLPDPAGYRRDTQPPEVVGGSHGP